MKSGAWSPAASSSSRFNARSVQIQSQSAVLYALIDGNNFFGSCERVFRPSLNGRPLVVLSNNDGCAISRSNEAKALGIKMGAPWFQFRHLAEEAGVVALSANFSLYGDISDRMMSVAAGLRPTQEIYSIDESFIGLEGVKGVVEQGQFVIHHVAHSVLECEFIVAMGVVSWRSSSSAMPNSLRDCSFSMVTLFIMNRFPLRY